MVKIFMKLRRKAIKILEYLGLVVNNQDSLLKVHILDNNGPLEMSITASSMQH